MDAIKYLKEKKRMTKDCDVTKCTECPFWSGNNGEYTACGMLEGLHPEKAVEIVEKWAKENPLKTRQSELMKVFPNIFVDEDGVFIACPRNVDTSFECNANSCPECRKDYWLMKVGDE